MKPLYVLLLTIALIAAVFVLSGTQKVEKYNSDELLIIRVKPGVNQEQLAQLKSELFQQEINLDYSESRYDELGEVKAISFSVEGPGFSTGYTASSFDRPLLFKYNKVSKTSQIGGSQKVDIPQVLSIRLLFGPNTNLLVGLAFGLIIANFIILLVKRKRAMPQ
ncbi:MAG TPA: hypothetical protein VJ953_09785 [Saprospiraceae bacterium]|nr:hypothetical protein [Saprospiraceae bacterium]